MNAQLTAPEQPSTAASLHAFKNSATLRFHYIQKLKALQEEEQLNGYKEMINSEGFITNSSSHDYGLALIQGLKLLPKTKRLKGYESMITCDGFTNLNDTNRRAIFIQGLKSLPKSDLLTGYTMMVSSENFTRLSNREHDKSIIQALKLLPKGSNQIILSEQGEQIILFCPEGSIDSNRAIALKYSQDNNHINFICQNQYTWRPILQENLKDLTPGAAFKMKAALLIVAEEIDVSKSGIITGLYNALGKLKPRGQKPHSFNVDVMFAQQQVQPAVI